MCDPRRNKGTAFTEPERHKYGLEGQLPAAIATIDLQIARRHALHRYPDLPQLRQFNLTARSSRPIYAPREQWARKWRPMSEATKMPQAPDQIVDVLAATGVMRVCGVVGDYLNGLTEAIRRQRKIEWVHARNEEAGAFAAGAEAYLKNELAVCAGGCGPGKPVMSGRDDSLIDLARTNLRH